MKTEIVKTEEKEINWDKVQLVKNNNLIVLTNGFHDDDTFKGTAIISDGNWYSGEFYEWDKKDFALITEIITIKFIP